MTIKQEITNHPRFSDVIREVEVLNLEVSLEWKYLKVKYKINYFQDGDNVSDQMSLNVKPWTVDNSYKVAIRDVNGDKIPNPNFVPEYSIVDYTTESEGWDVEEDGEFVPQPIYDENEVLNAIDEWENEWAFDYFHSLTFGSPTPVDMKELLKNYIILDDIENKRFDL